MACRVYYFNLNLYQADYFLSCMNTILYFSNIIHVLYVPPYIFVNFSTHNCSISCPPYPFLFHNSQQYKAHYYVCYSPSHTHFIFLLFFFFIRRYNPWWVLACSTISFHNLLSLHFSVQFLTFIFFKSSSTWSSHLSLGLPTCLDEHGSHSVTFLTVLVVSILITCAAHLLHSALQHLMGFGLLYDFVPQSSIFILLCPVSHFHLL